MNRHDRRSLDKIHQKFIAGLKPDVQYTIPQQKDRAEFFAWLEELKRKGEKPLVAHGALGEEVGRDGFVKQVHHPETGGTELEFWGITYRLKLNLQGIKLKNLDMAKALISEIPREILGHLPSMRLGAVIDFLFFRKRFILALDRYFYGIVYRSVRWNNLTESEYNPAARELKRAALTVLERDFGFSCPDMKVYMQDFNFPPPDGTMAHLLACVSLFIVLFLELDTAYRFRIQDAFGTLTETGMDRFWKGLETLLERETREGVGHKWKWLKRLITVGFWLLPDLKKFVKGLMDEALWTNVSMDEDDWYYCLRYVSYDFGGLSKDERFAERDRIDKEKNHLIFYA